MFGWLKGKEKEKEGIVPGPTLTSEENAAAKEAADKIKKDAEANTIILVARKHANGSLSWSIPTNLETASWLHKVLGIAIDEMVKMSFAAAQQKAKILVPKTKVIRPGQTRQ